LDLGVVVRPNIQEAEATQLERAPTSSLMLRSRLAMQQDHGRIQDAGGLAVSMTPRGDSGKTQARQALSPGRIFMVTA